MSVERETSVRFRSAVPVFTVPDVVRTAEYYRDVLGFQISGYWSTPPVFGIVHRGDVEIYFSRGEPAAQPTGRPEEACDAYIHIVGVDALAEEMRRSGAEILDGPVDRVFLQRELVVRDCNGLVLVFAEDISRRGV